MGACSQCKGQERSTVASLLGSLSRWQSCSWSSWVKLWAHSQAVLNRDSATMPCHTCKEEEKQGWSADLGLRTTCGPWLLPKSTCVHFHCESAGDDWFLKEPTPFLEKLQQFRKGESWALPPSSSCVIWLAHPLRQQELPSPPCQV